MFPQSIILCGVRDIKDYRIHSSREKAIITGGSVFNIKAESLRLGDFTEHEVQTLLFEHTKDTDQKFDIDACKKVWELTNGQPWLVNALAYEVCFKMKEGRDRSRSITAEMILTAKERLIQARVTHLDQLADKLMEPRVKRVIEPILAGRMDLCVRYGGVILGIELKVWRDGEKDPIKKGLGQIDGYLQGLCLNTGWLVIFDRRCDQPLIQDRTRVEPALTKFGKTIAVIRA